MSAPEEKQTTAVVVSRPTVPTTMAVSIVPPGEIVIYQLHGLELENLEAATTKERDAFGTFSACGSASIGIVATALAATGIPTASATVLWGLAGALGVQAVITVRAWQRERKERGNLMQRIKSRATTAPSPTPAPKPPPA